MYIRVKMQSDVPFFHGDYSGIGTMEKKWPAYTAIICLEDNDKIDINNFRPEVESPNKDMYDNRAIYEIRILDGDLFYIISD